MIHTIFKVIRAIFTNPKENKFSLEIMLEHAKKINMWEKSPTTKKREEIFPADEDRHMLTKIHTIDRYVGQFADVQYEISLCATVQILTILYVGRYIAHTPCTSEEDQVRSYTYTLSAWKGTEHLGTYTSIEIRRLHELYGAVEMKQKELSRE